MATKKLKGEDRLSVYRKVFNYFGPNKNGVITADGMGDALRALGHNPTLSEIREIIAEVNTHGDSLTFEQFTLFVDKYMNVAEDPEEELRNAFRQFDKDGNGFISVAELKERMTKLGEPLTWDEAEQMVREADINKDGQLDYNEFIRMVQDTPFSPD